jgi:hypothetical protein
VDRRDRSAAGGRGPAGRPVGSFCFFKLVGQNSTIVRQKVISRLEFVIGRKPKPKLPPSVAIVRALRRPHDPADATPHGATHRHAREGIDALLGRRVVVVHRSRRVPLRRRDAPGKSKPSAIFAEEPAQRVGERVG